MTTVFIAGSMNIKHLDAKVKDRIANIVSPRNTPEDRYVVLCQLITAASKVIRSNPTCIDVIRLRCLDKVQHPVAVAGRFWFPCDENA